MAQLCIHEPILHMEPIIMGLHISMLTDICREKAKTGIQTRPDGGCQAISRTNLEMDD